MELAPKPLRNFLIRLVHPQNDSKGCKNGYGFGYLYSQVQLRISAPTASLANISQEVLSQKCSSCQVPLTIVETRVLVK